MEESKTELLDNKVNLTQDELNQAIETSYQNGFNAGTAQVKQKALELLKNYAMQQFFEKQDDIAKVVRRIYNTINQL